MVYDDVIDQKLADAIEDWFINSGFPWYYNDITSTPKERFSDVAFDYPQFVHTFLMYEHGQIRENSGLAKFPIDLFKRFLAYKNIDEAKLLRCKANLQMAVPNESREYNMPHTDLEEPHYVMLYYVNDSDGDTFLFDNEYNITKRVKPKKGRFLVFDGSISHAGRHPINNSTRILINYDFIIPNGGKM